MKYTVLITENKEFKIEANSEKEAREKALKLLSAKAYKSTTLFAWSIDDIQEQ